MNVDALSAEDLRALVVGQQTRISELEARVKWFEKQVFGRKSGRRLSEASRFVQLTLGSVVEEEQTRRPKRQSKRTSGALSHNHVPQHGKRD